MYQWPVTKHDDFWPWPSDIHRTAAHDHSDYPAMTVSRKDISVSHHFSAPAERVFDAWLTPQLARQFLFATATGTMVRAEIDAKVGGQFTFVDRRDGDDVLHTGTYLEMSRPTRLKFTFAVPKYSEEFTEVTIDIVAAKTGCDLTLTQIGTLPDYEERTINGWTTILQKADQVIGN